MDSINIIDLNRIQNKLVTQKFLKQMPIWDQLEKFKAEVELLKRDLKTYCEAVDEREKRTQKLDIIRQLNLTNKVKLLSKDDSANKDLDLVLLYKKIDGEYRQWEDKEGGKTRSRKVSSVHDPLAEIRDSLDMLEQCVKTREEVFAMKEPGKPWVKCRVLVVFRKPKSANNNRIVTTFRLKTLPELGSQILDVDKYSVARIQNHSNKLRPTKRVIGGYSDDNLLPGIIGYIPNHLTKDRYMVLMDDGSTQLFQPNRVYPIIGQSTNPWNDARYLRNSNGLTELYLRHFFSVYPRRHLIRTQVGEKFTLLRNGTLVSASVIDIDCETIRVKYYDNTEENIWRGSLRLNKKTCDTNLHMRITRKAENFYDILVFYLDAYHKASIIALKEEYLSFVEDFNKTVVISDNFPTARKSTATCNKKPLRSKVRFDSHPVEENTKQIEVWDADEYERMKSHKCTPNCLHIPGLKTEVCVDDLIEEYRSVSDLKVPLLLGWKRNLYCIPYARGARARNVICYTAPCRKIFKDSISIRRYLINTASKLDIDYFSFERDLEINTCLGEIEAYHFVENIAVDSKTGKPLENKNISIFNQFSEEQLAEDFEYRNTSFPHPMLQAKGFSFNEDFKSGCDCEDDCYQRSTCSCHRLNEEFFGRKQFNRGSIENKCQYNNKRLNQQVGTGIFECNSFCKCSSKCSNRVVQNGIRFRLQVYKTLSKGWGVITLDDIPAGAYICTYAAELLDDADQYGDSDMYYADLDYITVNQNQKEIRSDSENDDEGLDVGDAEEDNDDDDNDDDDDYDDVPNKPLKRKKSNGFGESGNEKEKDDENSSSCSSSCSSSSSNSISPFEDVDDDGDIVLKPVGESNNGSNSCSDKPKEATVSPKVNGNSRYPKRKGIQQKRANNQNQLAAATAGAKDKNKSPAKEKRPQFKSIHQILGSHDYTLDARMQGNIGRFFNHSCDPNCFAQNVFLETHDLRFPIVAFFAHRNIKASDEITWNYNYKMGCIEGRIIECHCGASNCRGRIL